MHWPEVRDLLNRHCGYEMADDEILLLEIGGGFTLSRTFFCGC